MLCRLFECMLRLYEWLVSADKCVEHMLYVVIGVYMSNALMLGHITFVVCVLSVLCDVGM